MDLVIKFFYHMMLHRSGSVIMSCFKNTGSYMSAHVLLNLLNDLGKIDKMLGLLSNLVLFPNEFNKSNNTGA